MVLKSILAIRALSSCQSLGLLSLGEVDPDVRQTKRRHKITPVLYLLVENTRYENIYYY